MDLEGQLAKVIAQQDQSLNLRLLEEIDTGTFAAKQTELRDRAAKLNFRSTPLTAPTTKTPI